MRREHRRRIRAAARRGLVAILIVGGGACTTSDPGYDGRPSRAWIKDLASSDRVVRADATIALSNVLRLSSHTPGVAEALVAELADPEEEIRMIAGDALARESVRIPSAVAPLITMLRDESHAAHRKEVARILGTFGSVAESAVGALVDVLGDSDPYVRASGAQALGQIGPPATPSVPALGRLLRDPAPSVRQEAIGALVRIDPTGRAALPIIVGSLQDSLPRVRVAAAVALGSLQARALPALGQLIARLSDGDNSVRAEAVFAIGRIGPSAASAIPALTAAMNRDPASRVMSEAEDALAAIAGHPRPRRLPPELDQKRP